MNETLEPKFKIGDTVQIFKKHTNSKNWHSLMDECIGLIFEINECQYSKKYETFAYEFFFKDEDWFIHEESLKLVVSGVSNTNESISDNTNIEISTPCKT